MNKHTSQEDFIIEVQDPSVQDASDVARTKKRKQLFVGLAGALVLAGGGYFGYETIVAGGHVETDNAYVEADSALVTALTTGPVAEVRVVDTQMVKKGDVLVVLDDVDRRLELQQAEAALAQIARRVRGYSATDNALNGQIAAREADLVRAKAELARVESELERRLPLASSGAISAEQLTTAKTAVDAAKAAVSQAEANLRAARGSREANYALISGVSLEQNPEVMAAKARVDQARVALERTTVRAPVDGVVAKRLVQVGQMVQPGAHMMTIVPIQQAYVNANFKEVQLERVRVGQPVELKSDLYGGGVVYHGKVAGFSGGTGAAFAVVPAQNATGNWIKVVQRLPVRIELDPEQLKTHPLKVGLSMKATIDVTE